MGVLSCDRHLCEKVMCNKMADGKYICDDCANEFKRKIGDREIPTSIMSEKFQAFMETPKPRYSQEDITTVEQFLTKIDF